MGWETRDLCFAGTEDACSQAQDAHMNTIDVLSCRGNDLQKQ